MPTWRLESHHERCKPLWYKSAKHTTRCIRWKKYVWEWYGDQPLGDERDKKQPSEIKAFNPNPEAFGGGKLNPKEPENDADSVKVDYTGALKLWREKALREGVGKLPDVPAGIPKEVAASINASLRACKTKQNTDAIWRVH